VLLTEKHELLQIGVTALTGRSTNHSLVSFSKLMAKWKPIPRQEWVRNVLLNPNEKKKKE
jgi:hypothetical protein